MKKQILLFIVLGTFFLGCGQDQDVVAPNNSEVVSEGIPAGANLRPAAFDIGVLKVTDVSLVGTSGIAGDGSLFYMLGIAIQNTSRSTFKYASLTPSLRITTPTSPSNNPLIPWSFSNLWNGNTGVVTKSIAPGETYIHRSAIWVNREIMGRLRREGGTIDLYMDLKFYEGVGPSWNTTSSGPWRIETGLDGYH